MPIDNVLSLAIEELGCERVTAILNVADRGTLSAVKLIEEVVPRLNRTQVAEAKQRLCSAIGTTEAEIRRTSKLFLSTDDIKRLSSLYIELGNHSMSHTYFRTLSPIELETEIGESRTVLENLSGQPVQYLSIPYGNKLDATEDALAVARRNGHRAIFLVHAKSNRFPPASDIFYRVSLGETAPEELRFKLRVMPTIRSVGEWMW